MVLCSLYSSEANKVERNEKGEHRVLRDLTNYSAPNAGTAGLNMSSLEVGRSIPHAPFQDRKHVTKGLTISDLRSMKQKS